MHEPPDTNEPTASRSPLPALFLGSVLFVGLAVLLHSQQGAVLTTADRIAGQLDEEGKLRPLADIVETTRALKLVTVMVDSTVRTEVHDEGWRGKAAASVKAPVRYVYGVDLSGCHWVQGATNAAGSHGSPAAPPALGVSIEQNASGLSLSEMLERGDIQAIIGSGLPDALKTSPDVQRLFPDFHAVEMESFRRTRVFPIMHLVAMRRDTYEKHPFIAKSLYKAMTDAKNIALKKMRDLGTLRYMLPGMTAELDEIDDVFGGDPWPYGIEPNRPTLEALVRYLAEQSLIKAPIPLDELFVPI